MQLLLCVCLCVYVWSRQRWACVAVHDFMLMCGCMACLFVCVPCLCSSAGVCACHTSVAVCSNLRSQLGALVIIQTLPFAPTLKAFIWRTWNSRAHDKASNTACRPKRSGKGEEMHGGIDGIVFLWRFALTLVLYLLCSNCTWKCVITGS